MGEVVTFKRPAGLPPSWTDEQLLTAVKAHVFGGNVGQILSISDAEVAHWTKTKQWVATTKLVMPDVVEVLTHQMTRIVSKALVSVDQRIEEGDPVINLDGTPKTDEDGKQVYRPLRAKDLTDIAVKLNAEKRALEAKIGKVTDDEGQISLEKLVRGLERYAHAKDITGELAS